MVKGNNATFNYSTDRARIAELEAENAALREFVATYDETFVDMEPGATNLAAIAEEHRLRQRLATEFGLPLPEVER